jgi:probable F420-dependent oxidoreductase
MSERAGRLDPLVSDLNAFVLTGRVKGVRRVFDDAAEAERLGIKRLFLAERYDLREAGALLGGVAAHTTRLEVGTGAIVPASRSPLMTAALGATMQSAYGPRFNLGLGRGISSHLAAQGFQAWSWSDYADYVDIVRRLWAGETVAYHGRLGSYESLKLVDPLEEQPPLIWVCIVGGPVACRWAARLGDAVMLSPFLTAEAVGIAVTTIRKAREELDLDPAIPICHPIVTAPELDEQATLELTKARLVGYLWMPELGSTYMKLNGWSQDIVNRIRDHEQFAGLSRGSVDQSFRLNQLHGPAASVPDEWVSSTAAVGSIRECIQTLRAFRQAGADELAIYGSTPEQNAALVRAWRQARYLDD